MTREKIIQIARQRHARESELLEVLEVAKETDDRRLLGICLDCFRSVLVDSLSDATCEVVMYLGQLVRDPAYRRIRPKILWTLLQIGRASHLVLPQLVATWRERGRSSVLVPARSAIVSVAWETLTAGGPAERAKAIEAFEQIGSLGLVNLRHFLRTNEPDPVTRSRIESAIERLTRGYAGT